MRYPCVGSPFCLRSFENGHVLRAHQLSCQHAQTKLNKAQQRDEHARSIQYDYNIRGIKANQFYPTFTGLDNQQKLQIRDRFKVGTTSMGPYRRIRQPANPKLVIVQTKSTSMDFSGYYT